MYYVDEQDRNFDALRQEVMDAPKGILRVQMKDLRGLECKSKLGRRVNESIEKHLQKFGISHFPKELPLDQNALVDLAMRGSTGEKLLQQYVRSVRREAGADAPILRATANASRSIPPIVPDSVRSRQVPAPTQRCSECGVDFSMEETLHTSPGFWDCPYNYSQSSGQYCLACWLGVGPKDIEKMEAERPDLESSAQWVQQTRTCSACQSPNSHRSSVSVD